MRTLAGYQPTRFMLPTSRYCKEAADFAVNFIESLPHTKGKWKGTPFKLIDWQEQLVRDVFGILTPEGTRQFVTVYVEVPKKNGKSELAAAIALLLLCADFENSAEVFGCAADIKQARIVYNVAKKMIEYHPDPGLRRLVKITDSQKVLYFKPTDSTYEVLSAEAFTKHGFSVHGVIFDELHAQPNRRLYDTMTTGSGDAREQPLFFIITTAGCDMNSIGYEVHCEAKGILANPPTRVDPTFYPVIFGADEDDDWTDPAVWAKVNPSLGVTIPLSKLQAQCDAARGNTAKENNFRQLRLNQWVASAVRWMQMEAWNKCNAPVDRVALKGRICYAGLDLASTQDTTALVLVFPPHVSEEGGKYYVLAFFWLPKDRVSMSVDRDHVRYDDWERDGILETTPGSVTDYSFIRKKINDLAREFQINEIAVDPYNARHLLQELAQDGFAVLEFRQGALSLSPPMKELMRLVYRGEIVHGGNPMLDWQMDNLTIIADANENIRPVKGKKRSGRIDGVVSLVMALDGAILQREEQPNVYDGSRLTFV